MFEPYQPQNEMSLWWLGDAVPTRVARLVLADNHRKVGLEYDADWIAQGFALSDDLPLGRGLMLPAERDAAAGPVDDARPDRWGDRVIRHIYKPARLSVLEYLYFAGDNRLGGLGVSTHDTVYRPCANSAIAAFDKLGQMEHAIAAVLAGERLSDEFVRLVRPGPSFGGARPKSIIELDGHPWVVKFSEGEEIDTPLIEHATMTLASRCGIDVAASRALPLRKHRHAVAIQRFDRVGDRRMHVVSAHTVLRAAGLPLGYPELAQLMRRMCHPDAIRAQQEELFRRMVFNILMDNTDDHEKNHAFIRSANGYYALSPAYDVVPAVQGLGCQQLRVGQRDTESSLDNALSEVAAFGLQRERATQIVGEIVQVVNGWQAHFQSAGVVARDLEELAQYIDGARLRVQRDLKRGATC